MTLPNHRQWVPSAGSFRITLSRGYYQRPTIGLLGRAASGHGWSSLSARAAGEATGCSSQPARCPASPYRSPVMTVTPVGRGLPPAGSIVIRAPVTPLKSLGSSNVNWRSDGVGEKVVTGWGRP